jgi:hypothetical protein
MRRKAILIMKRTSASVLALLFASSKALKLNEVEAN